MRLSHPYSVWINTFQRCFSLYIPLQVSSACLLMASSTADFHFNLGGGFSMSSEREVRSYWLSNSRIRLNQGLSVGAFMASCRKYICLSIPSLVIHLQKRHSMFLCSTLSTGAIPSRAKEGDCVLSGRCCTCFNDFLWYCSSWLISAYLSSCISRSYKTLGMTYVDHS